MQGVCNKLYSARSLIYNAHMAMQIFSQTICIVSIHKNLISQQIQVEQKAMQFIPTVR